MSGRGALGKKGYIAMKDALHLISNIFDDHPRNLNIRFN